MANLLLVSDLAALGVVPVFFNAGAALLPALLGGFAAVGGVLLRPRELARVCREKPHVPVIALAVLGAIGLGVAGLLMWPAGAAATPPRGPGSPDLAAGDADWAKVALEIIAQKQRGGAPPPTQPAPNAATPDPAAPSARATIYRGSVQRRGWDGGPAPLGLSPIWEYTEKDTMFVASPVVVGDFVYGASCYLDPPRSLGTVFCLDAASGKELWKQEFKSLAPQAEFTGFFSSPAVTADGRTLVIGQGLHADFACELVGLDARSGRVRWLLPTPLHIEGSPAIEGDLAVAGAGAVEAGQDHKPRGDPQGRGHPGFVVAVRISDGKEQWRYTIEDPESSPALDQGVVYIGSGFNGRAVVALRTQTDAELKAQGLERLIWRTPTPYPATGCVTLTDDLVLIGSGNSDYVVAAPNPEGLVLALERRTGKVRWQARMPDSVLGAIAVGEGRAICPALNGEVIALALADGKELWRSRVSDRAPILAGCAYTRDLVYAVSKNGYLAVLDAADGRQLERVYLNAPGQPGEMGLSTSSPFVAAGRLYVGSETGGLRCFRGKEYR